MQNNCVCLPSSSSLTEKDIKIIVCLRNPVERSYSAYNHLKRYNIYENLTFEDALKKEKNRFENDKFISPAAKYFEVGLYYQKIKKILQNFDKVKIIIYEEFVSNPNRVLKECTDFLEIDSFNFKTNIVYMKGGWRWKNKYLKQIARSFNIFRLLNLLFGPKIAKWVKSIILDMSTHKISEINAKTKKMFQGHRGANHPVQNLENNKVEITSQNHGFVVTEKSIPKNVKITHKSLFDGSVEGIEHKNKKIFAVQYHPEASPGPHDSQYLFQKFKRMIDSNA